MWVRHDETTGAVTACNSLQFAAWGNVCPAKPASSRTIPCGFRRLQTGAKSILRPPFDHALASLQPPAKTLQSPATSRQGIRPVKSRESGGSKGYGLKRRQWASWWATFGTVKSLQEAAGHWRHGDICELNDTAESLLSESLGLGSSWNGSGHGH